MKGVFDKLGTGAGIAGVLLCLAAAIWRITGHYYVSGIEVMTIFTGGIGLMVFACLLKVHVLGMRV